MKFGPILAALGLAAGKAAAEIAASSPISTSLSQTETNKLIGTLPIESGDYLAVLAGSNKGSTPVESGLLVSTSDGAALDPVQYTIQSGGGPSASVWYTQATSGGQVSVSLENPDAGYITVAAYVVSATGGETVEVEFATASDITTTATSITNTYTFAEPKTGVILETVSTYASEGAVPAGTLSYDEVNSASPVKRAVGSTTVTDASGFDSVYALSGDNSKVNIAGAAFVASDVAPPPPPPPVASEDRTRQHPSNTYNVVFIAIDDMRPLIDAYGETEPLRPITPNMDRLVRSGVMFANAHCQQAVCNASRASLLTGLRPDTTQCWKLETLFRDKLPNIITLPQHFGANGYRVHGIGKIYHNTNAEWQDDPASWNEGWASSATAYKWYEADKAALEDAGTGSVSATDAGEVNTRDGNRPIVDEDYNDGYAAQQAVARIAEYAASWQTNGTPFFLGVGFQKPHLPFNCPKTYWDLYDPAEIDLTGYTGIRKMPIGCNKFTAPYGGEPSAFLDVTGTSDNGMPNAVEARHLIHGYLACVSFIDTQIGKLLDALDDPDGDPGTDDSITDSTIIVLWGDHGFHLGDHNGFWAKHSNFEISTRVPLIVSTPALQSLGSGGARCVGLVELVDLYPTLVDLCSLPAPAQPTGQTLQGTTFLPLLEDPAQPWKKAVFSQFQRSINSNDTNDVPVANSGTGMGYSIRTERYRYTEWWVTESTDETDRHIIKSGITEPGHIELYDYVADPGETTNLASYAVYSNLVAELSTLLNDTNGTSAGDGWTEADADAPTAYPVDSNVWKTNYLAPGRTLSELDFSADPDGDGLANRFEYKFGTHPFEADNAAVESGLAGGQLSITWPDVESRTNVQVAAVTSTNLVSGGWSPAGVTQTNSGQRGSAILRTDSVTTDATTRFLKLEATDL
jgi:iduronate 2-sulfatase